jgi:hypothetical protein
MFAGKRGSASYVPRFVPFRSRFTTRTRDLPNIRPRRARTRRAGRSTRCASHYVLVAELPLAPQAQRGTVADRKRDAVETMGDNGLRMESVRWARRY